ncbi:MAG: coenzyme F420-0:L-glutamate ligase, partial [Nitrosopumilus sp.]|nr:coenzyme F420-0:L-glutamate ligase [Nitrosopumilus sp.]
MQIIPIPFEKEITVDDDVSELILSSGNVLDGDIIVIAQKIISKQEGRIVELSSVSPSLLSQGISSQYGKDPNIVELILSESKRIVRMKNGVIIVETHNGFICANAGIDESNVVDGFATLLPL